MKVDIRILAAALILAPALSWADPLSQRGLEESQSKVGMITDAMIEERKKALDKVLAQRIEQANREQNEATALEAKLKQEKVEFEKKQIADRKATLDSMKAETDPKKRSSMYGKMDAKQKNERRSFFNQQMSKRDQWASGSRKSMYVWHDDMAGNMLARPAAAKPAPVATSKSATTAPAKSKK